MHRFFCKIVLIALFLAIACTSKQAFAEFYKYIDENGIVRYTDNLSKVPENQRLKMQTYSESHPKALVREEDLSLENTMDNKGAEEDMPLDGVGTLSEADLTRTKEALDMEYNAILKIKTEIEKDMRNAVTQKEKEEIYSRTYSLNKRITLYEKMKKKHNDAVKAFKKAQKSDRGEDFDSVLEEKDGQPSEIEASKSVTSIDKELLNTRRVNLERRKQELINEYNALLKEKTQIDQAVKNAKTVEERETVAKMIELFNNKNNAYKQKNSALEKDVKDYHSALEKAMKTETSNVSP